MRPELQPDQLSFDERYREIADLLARGLLRLRDRAAFPIPAITVNSLDSKRNPLEFPADPSVTGPAG